MASEQVSNELRGIVGMKAISALIDEQGLAKNCLVIHFDHEVTDLDRKNICAAHNAAVRETKLVEALKALQLQALQSNVNHPANAWGREALEMARSALSAIPTDDGLGTVSVKPTHRHVKRGTEYVLIGIGKMQADTWVDMFEGGVLSVDMREVAIYRSVDDGSLWVRPREEFEDGRFVAAEPEGG